MQQASQRTFVKADVLREFAKKHPEVSGARSIQYFLNTAEGKALVAEVGEGPMLGYASYDSLDQVVRTMRKPAKASTEESRRKSAAHTRRGRARAAAAAAAAPGSRISGTTQLEEPEVRSLLAKKASGDYVRRGDSRMTTSWVALAGAMDVEFSRPAGYFVPEILCSWFQRHVTRKAKK